MSDEMYKKLCMARHLFSNRLIESELPSSTKARSRSTKAKRKTWRDWWQEQYNENIDDYIRLMRRKKQEAA